MSLLLLVEDKEGRESLETLARKILRGAVQARFVPKGDMLQVHKMKELLRLHYRSHRNVSRILICRDSECTPIASTQKLCKQAEAQLNNQLGRGFAPVKYVVVDHSLEGWLGSDTQALRRVLGHDAWIPHHNFEDNCRPAELMDEVFVRNGHDGYEKSRHARLLAEASEPRNIAARSRTFSYFQQSILSARH